MNIISITPESIVNGNGLRTVFWLQGCPHHCDGCHNPDSWEFKDVEIDTDYESTLHNSMNDPLISGITISGGEPLADKNLSTTLEILSNLRPNKDVWIYTGYIWEKLMERQEPRLKKILLLTDVLVDGRYNKQLDSGYMRGSTNQRIISCKDSINSGELVSFNNAYYQNFKDVERR